jgi:hypothetical protein
MYTSPEKELQTERPGSCLSGRAGTKHKQVAREHPLAPAYICTQTAEQHTSEVSRERR